MPDTTTRLGLHRPTGGDPAAVPADLARVTDQLDAVLLGYDQGPLASRPSAGIEGRMYYAIDDGTLYYDMGSGWVPAAAQPGDVVFTARSEASRLGWLPCNGDSVSRTDYPALFSAIGTTFGAGDGRTTFGLPNLQGRAPIGAGTGSGLSPRVLGALVGVERYALALAEMPSHAHSISVASAGSHSHGGATASASIAHAHTSQDGHPFLTDRNSAGGGAYDLSSGNQMGNGGGGWTQTADVVHAHGIATDGSHAHTATAANAGSGSAHENMQPSLALNHWIKV